MVLRLGYVPFIYCRLANFNKILTFGFFLFSVALACNSFLAIQRENLQTSMEIVTSTYSSDMRNLIMYLLTNPNRLKTVNDLMPMMGKILVNYLSQKLYLFCKKTQKISNDVDENFPELNSIVFL